jgi:hypothetical protein
VCDDAAVGDSRVGQGYCDWCYRPLTVSSIEESERIGLDAERSWACESCLAAHAYRLPPDGWEGDRDRAGWRFGVV